MAGGSGTRFWPKSREACPKQLMQVASEATMLQRTVRLLIPHVQTDRIVVVTGAAHEAESRRQLCDLPGVRVVAEPQGRDTAACVGLAAVLLLRDDPEAVMVVTPADHRIEPAERFHAALGQAEEIAERAGALVTLGVKPRFPSTEFGYVERGEPLDGAGEFPAYRVASFREKPDRAAAQEFVRAGRFYWNSGTFVWRARDILDALRQFMPKLHEALGRIDKALGTGQEDRVLAGEYARLDRISIDYGVMEKARNSVVLEVDYDWDDLGSWEALARLHGADPQGNTVLGTGCLTDAGNCIVVSEEDHVVGVVGVEGLVIVHSPDATLVCRRDRVGDVKELVRRLREQGLGRHL
jgi:mannose-1-phosphate guanylyltransferase